MRSPSLGEIKLFQVLLFVSAGAGEWDCWNKSTVPLTISKKMKDNKMPEVFSLRGDVRSLQKFRIFSALVL